MNVFGIIVLVWIILYFFFFFIGCRYLNIIFIFKILVYINRIMCIVCFYLFGYWIDGDRLNSGFVFDV